MKPFRLHPWRLSGLALLLDIDIPLAGDARLLTSYRVRHVLGVRHLTLADFDLFVDYRPLLEVDLLLVNRDGKPLPLIDRSIRGQTVDRRSFDGDLFARDGDLDRALFANDRGTNLNLAGLDALLVRNERPLRACTVALVSASAFRSVRKAGDPVTPAPDGRDSTS